MVFIDEKMTAGPKNPNETTSRERKNSKETIHSGHFMVSDFEAEDQDDEGIEVPDPSHSFQGVEEIQGVRGIKQGGVITYAKPTKDTRGDGTTVSIDGSLTKLFKTMSLAYRQNITSPKWNCFKGLRLRWKDKIRLNNVIWRCWHMQYIQKKNMTVCQFALDVDIHNRPETVVLEGKYWKRHMNAVTAEYKKWRLYYKNSLSGMEPVIDQPDMSFLGLEEMDWAGSFFNKQGTSSEEKNLFDSIDFTDMLFSPFSKSPQLFPFPNPREIARGTGNSDLVQPGLIQLQPDLMDDDMIDIHEMLAGRGLPTVPEEDLFPEVEDTVGLPPSSSPPSVSTPTPTTTNTEYGLHLPHAHVYPRPNQPSSPQLFSPKDSFIPNRQESPPPNSPLPPTPTQQRKGIKFDVHHESSFRPFSRSWSAIEISLQHDQQQREASHNESLREGHTGDTPFAVPKTIPKKKYLSGGHSYISQSQPNIPSTGAAIIGPTTLVFPAPLSPPNSGNLSPLSTPVHSPLARNTHYGVAAPSSPRGTPMEVHDTNFSAPSSSDSTLFAQLLTSESCSTPSSQSPQSGHPSHKNKVARGAPLYPNTTVSVAISPGLNPSSSRSSGASSDLVINTNKSCNLPVVTSSHHHPHILPNVTLSAVTPSSIKSISSNPSQHTTDWSSSGCLKEIKSSPPYPEPASPANSQSSTSPPTKPFKPKNDAERVQYKEHRRVCHINAEQKRRCNIKYNFDMLHSLIPSVNQNPNSKVSKATMLHKGAEYIMQMKQERQQLSDQAEQLRNQIETLSQEISMAQSLLPATGAPMNHTRHNKIKEKFENYVRERTLANPKYYILSLIAQPLLQTFNSSVSTASVDDLCRSCTAWLDQNCSLNVLRPVVSNAMRKLSTTTNILTTPETIYEDIFRLVTKQEGSKVNNVQFSPEHTSPR